MTITTPIGPAWQGADPLYMLQAEVVPVLRELLDGVCHVWDYVPEDDTRPYVVWNTAWLAQRDALTQSIDRVWFQIDAWSGTEYRGYARIAEIADMISDRLDHAIIVADGWWPVQILREQAHETRDRDVRRFAITFNCPYVAPIPEEDI